MPEENKKEPFFKQLKTRVVNGARSFALFFREFKWDKAHVSVLIKYVVEVLLFAFIITFDLCMKDFLYDFVEVRHGGNYTVIEGFLDLTYSENTGMGFGLGKESTLGITVMTTILIVAILGYLLFFKKEKAYIRIPLIMVAAGGIGNLVDRTQLGYVRDFFEFTFMDFAIFNIADAFVTVGAIVLILALVISLFKPSKESAVKEEEEEEQPLPEGAKAEEVRAESEDNAAAEEEKVRFTACRTDVPEKERAEESENGGGSPTPEESGPIEEKESAEKVGFSITPVDGTEDDGHESDGK